MLFSFAVPLSMSVSHLFFFILFFRYGFLSLCMFLCFCCCWLCFCNKYTHMFSFALNNRVIMLLLLLLLLQFSYVIICNVIIASLAFSHVSSHSLVVITVSVSGFAGKPDRFIEWQHLILFLLF